MGHLTPAAPATFDRGDGVRLACAHRPGAGPTIVFLPGYGSDMTGGKASALDAWAGASGRAMLRFDWSGCGASEGAFADQTLARWRDDALAAIDLVTGDLVTDDRVSGDVVLVGSSMGGWVMLLAALARPRRVRALVGIAAAPDFSDWGYDEGEKRTIRETGRLERPVADGDPQVTTHAFWASAETLKLLDAPIAFDGPVRLLHGEADEAVPVAIAHRLAARLRSADVQTILVKGGDHRLSRDGDIDLLVRTVVALMERP